MKRVAAIIGLVALLSGVASGQKVSTGRPEQQSFEIGHHKPVVKHPVALSDAELAAIRQVTPAEQNIAGLTLEKPTPTPSIPKPTREGLEVALVHLNDSGERDLVVIGSGRRYATPKVGSPWAVAPFWVIREEHGKPKVLLAVFTRELRIFGTKHRGFVDVGAYRNTGIGGLLTFFEFDGNTYVWAGENGN